MDRVPARLALIALIFVVVVHDLRAAALAQAAAQGTITGTVTDVVTSKPISGALVMSSAGGFAALTDQAGVYQAAVPAGTYSVSVTAQGRPGQSVFGVAVRADATTTLDFRLPVAPSTGVLTGVVRKAGTAEPLSNALVKLTPDGPSTTTNEAGAYMLSPAAGTYTMTVSATGYGVATITGIRIVNQVYSARDVALVLQTNGTLTGHVTGGTPAVVIPNAIVAVAPGGQAVTTNASGVYTLSLPPGTYSVTTSAIGYDDAAAPGVTVPGGTTTTRDVVMTVTHVEAVMDVLHSFRGGADGADPNGTLVLETDGSVYGTTRGGGAYGAGTIYRLTPAGTLTILHTFTGPDGAAPSPLIQAADGDLYGTTAWGGANDYGTIFRMDLSGALTTLHSFSANSEGVNPGAPLVQGADGNFYGTTLYGFGVASTAFRITSAGAFATLHAFDVEREGIEPYTALVQAADGNFYGTMFQGSAAGCGAVFMMTPAGIVTLLHVFNGLDEGANPDRLTLATDGNLYGGAQFGGAAGGGTLFQLTPAGQFTVLHQFEGADGARPGSLTQAADGDFYGVTRAGGSSNLGIAFRISSTGVFTILRSFSTASGEVYPDGAWVQSADGRLYGAGGGVSNVGTVFTMTTTGTVTVLHSFFGGADGTAPTAPLRQATDGNFYGTTEAGGSAGQGTVFKMTPDGVVTTLHAFAGGSDGRIPAALLVQATDGSFYGTTYGGGADDLGTVFKMDASGAVSILHVFTDTDGAHPWTGLLQAADGNLYGTTYDGGSAEWGTIFKITPTGVFTVLHSFAADADGANPFGEPLIQATDGNIYGTTLNGGVLGGGTIFQMTPDGTVTVMHAFDLGDPWPNGVMQAIDGSFYGTTYGDIYDFGCGSIFRMSPSGAFTTLYAFPLFGPDGTTPLAGLVQGADGNFYGTTLYGPTFSPGSTVFRMTPAGSVTTLHNMASADGNFVWGAVIQATDGNFYGTAISGGGFQLGTVFRVRLSPPADPPRVTTRELRLGDDVAESAAAAVSSVEPKAPAVTTSVPDAARTQAQTTPATVEPPKPAAITTVDEPAKPVRSGVERRVTFLTTSAPTAAPLPTAVPASVGMASARPIRQPVHTPPAVSDARPMKWELEAFGGAMFLRGLSHGVGSLPPPGIAFVTTTGEPSRHVSSWYVGDGARLLNDVNASFAVGERITPIDSILDSAATRVRSGGGGGVRIGRALTRRLSVEVTVESNRLHLQPTNATLDAIEASRAGFLSAWRGLATFAQFANATVTSAVTLETSPGHQLITTGALNVALKETGNIIPFIVAGGGLASNAGGAVRATIAGDYQFVLEGGTPIHETDAVTIRFGAAGRSAVAVIGGGVRYSIAKHIGIRVDVRSLFSANRLATTLDTKPFVSTLTPVGSGASWTSPGIQFSNDASIGIPSTLSGPAQVNVRTFTGRGLTHQIRMTTGFVWRF